MASVACILSLCVAAVGALGVVSASVRSRSGLRGGSMVTCNTNHATSPERLQISSPI